ncbi:trypsin-like peptidase domain-containing protein [Streptomyces olivoreticuli]
MKATVRTRISRARLRTALVAGTAGVITAGLLWTVPAQAGDHTAQPPGRSTGAPLIDAGSAAGKKFRSSGRLVGGDGMTCTATVVAASAQPDPAQKALIISNGHCVSGTLATNEVRVDWPVPEGQEKWMFTPAYFHDNTTEQKTFDVEHIAYATMKDSDVSVLRLSATYGDLAKLDVTPRTLSSARVPALHTQLQAAHAPADGVPEGERFLRLSNCQVTGSGIALHEHTWLWKNFARTDCLGISGGSSGGTVTTATGDQLVGMINTVSTPGYLGCGLGRPCEGNARGLVVPADDTVYFTPVDAVASCLDKTGLRLNRPGCRLDPGTQVKVEFTGKQTQSVTPEGDARWDAHVTSGANGLHSYVAFKTGPFGTTDCTKPEGYGLPQPLGASGVDYHELLPGKDSLYVLCAVGGPRAAFRGADWSASLIHPSYAYVRVDNTPPAAEPSLNVQNIDEESYWVYPVYKPWEITSYKVKYGLQATTDCADSNGYRYYLNVPSLLKVSEGPWVYCAIGYDNANNATAPKIFNIG